MPTVVCGPSGVGKGTLLTYLKQYYTNAFAVSVSHTTRQPRPGEVNGETYHFVSREQFEQGISRGEFVEYADVHGNWYGTSKQALRDVADRKKIALLEIDVQGAQNIKKLSGVKAFYLFITMTGYFDNNKLLPDCGIELLSPRLAGRGTETIEQVEKRMKTAEKELDFFANNRGFFDKVITNDDLKKSQQDITRIFAEWYPWIQTQHK
ncbi:hypothetical protein RFI_10581 [Reticulomyxa filosa]|uniref:guanylate kinase n=1 Tax=Reticulomyxa filosa TaxID=46433 RepID=X6NKW3_RETFI|nr:hypothetical protein RFI_10581 [Reticulomyxa filosa]|eukprot:ETO26558.1 hypothetical protein RFI_10581 [Reticulomyxa filosa]